MRRMTVIPPAQDGSPIELRHLRVAAYCQVSTELEDQTSSRIAGAVLSTVDRRKTSLGKCRNIFRKSHRSEFERTVLVSPGDSTVPQKEN